ncbi:hypothetical protein EG68_02455 [Paragonimus skrjabini miyazakii]|uniref:K Homology domain-containing protein n=1 Tax=Paragonimus skrjabini miyazakii TaxID=59628 RepID=A0A8S9Z7E1_9TREM|nr:hypothetical protein EG68_02455 [Paragonimus skrjabini miyazakii]
MTIENDATSLNVEEQSSFSQTRKSDPSGSSLERVSETTPQKRSKGDVHFKILVPSIAAGAIIGKGGEAITDIQNKTSAKVKMSKANDFYPGTTERVCLIMGTIESILKVFQYISEKIYEKPELLLRTTAKGSRMPAERHKQVKILVPNSTAGIIIGKGGSFIKEVKESTGVFIQVSQKSKELSLAERCVTVAGELSQTYEAVKQLLVKIADDPQSSSCPNISYAEVPQPVASAYPTGSPYALVLGSNFGMNNCPMSATGSDNLIAGAILTNSGSNSANFPPSQLGSFSPVSPTGSAATPVPVFGTSPPSAFAAAVAAMSAATSFSPCSNGRNSSILNSNAAGRALTGRGVSATGHRSSNSQIGHHSQQSLLGSAATQLGVSGSTAYGSPASVNSVSSTRSTIGLEMVRSILRSAGYSDMATEEIANAMHVLNLYGFISMSSLTGCAAGSAPISTAMNNGHFAMAGSPIGGSLSGYVSTGSQSPGFSTEIGGHFRTPRGFGGAPAQFYTQSGQHYQQYHKSSSTIANQLVHSQVNSCGPIGCSSITKSLKSHDPLDCSMPATTNVCEASNVHTSEININLYPGVALNDPVSMQSPVSSPIIETGSLSPALVSKLPLNGTNISGPEVSLNHEFIHRLSDAGFSTKLKTENGRANGVTNGGARPNSLWDLGCSVIQQTNSSTST